VKKNDRWLSHEPLSKLRKAEKNPKQHDVEALRASFDRFGFVAPPVIDERTGRLGAGHGRAALLSELYAKDQNAPPPGVRPKLAKGKVVDWLVPVVRGWRSKNKADAEAYLIADNRITEAGGWDDRALTEMLRGLSQDDSLAGTGFDDAQLAALMFVTRPASEVATINEAAHWAGMPEFDAGKPSLKIVVNVETPEQREQLLKLLGVDNFGRKDGDTWACWWPARPKDDPSSVKFEATPP